MKRHSLKDYVESVIGEGIVLTSLDYDKEKILKSEKSYKSWYRQEVIDVVSLISWIPGNL
jgi:hypothetical protein